MPVKQARVKVEKDELLIDGGKSAVMTMRRRSLTDRSRLELWQQEGTTASS